MTPRSDPHTEGASETWTGDDQSAARRITELNEMLRVSEEHAEHYTARAVAAEALVTQLEGGLTVAHKILDDEGYFCDPDYPEAQLIPLALGDLGVVADGGGDGLWLCPDCAFVNPLNAQTCGRCPYERKGRDVE